MPAFSQKNTFIQTLDSASRSHVTDIEIIVCDDASTDRTAAVIEEWAEKNRQHCRRFILLRQDLNRGLCYSMNDLVAEATGGLIMVIAGDDYFLPGGILAKAQGMVDHSEWGGAFCDVEAVGPEG